MKASFMSPMSDTAGITLPSASAGVPAMLNIPGDGQSPANFMSPMGDVANIPLPQPTTDIGGMDVRTSSQSNVTSSGSVGKPFVSSIRQFHETN